MTSYTINCVIALIVAMVIITSGQRSTRRSSRGTTLKPSRNISKPFNCSLEHRKHPSSDSMFQKKWNNVWRNYTCPVAGLVWNQELCRCEQGPGNIDPCAEYSPVPDSPKKYIWTVWGRNFTLSCGYDMVWSQDACTCRFAFPGEIASPGAASDPCEVMLNATFNKEFKDEARGSYIGRYPWSGAKIEKRNGAYGGGAVCLKKGYVTVPAFNGNELSRTFQIQFRMRLGNEEGRDLTTRFDVLVSNGCSMDKPTVALEYRRSDRAFVVGITDRSETISLTCSDRGSITEWKKVSLEVSMTKIVLVVNGRTCIEEESSSLTDQPIPTRCPLSFGGDSRTDSKVMTGCFDEIIVRRYCVV